MARPRNRPPANRRSPGAAPPAASGSSRKWVWMLVSVVAGAGIFAIALSAGSQSQSESVTVRDPVLVAQGAEIYAANCAVCHGVDLQGTDTGPPFLNVIYAPNHHADEAFQRAVLGGVVAHHWNYGTMAAIDGLDRAEVALVVEFVRAEQEAAGILSDPSHP